LHLPLKNAINALNKRAIRRDELAANHSQGLASLPVVSADDKLMLNQRSSAPREPSPLLLVSGAFTVHRTSWKDRVDSGFENNFVGIRFRRILPNNFGANAVRQGFVRNGSRNGQ
jgi:hypothetical protein